MRSAVAFAILCPSRSCRCDTADTRCHANENDIRDARGRSPRRTGRAPRGAGYRPRPALLMLTLMPTPAYPYALMPVNASAPCSPRPAKFAASARAPRRGRGLCLSRPLPALPSLMPSAFSAFPAFSSWRASRAAAAMRCAAVPGRVQLEFSTAVWPIAYATCFEFPAAPRRTCEAVFVPAVIRDRDNTLYT